MLRENEYTRDKIAQREYDKIEKATEKIQNKADALSKFKDHLHSCYPPPYPPYYQPPVYMTPRVEKTTKYIENDPCCSSRCRTRK